MIRTVLAVLFMCCMSLLAAQNPDRFRNFHGLVQGDNHFFEAEGQEIFIRTAPSRMDEKGIAKTLKKYNLKDALRTDTVLNQKVVVLVKKETQKGFQLVTVYYLLPNDQNTTTVIGFAGVARNVSLEHFVVEAWQSNMIPDNVYADLEPRVIDFVGRTISLGGACRWMSPHNVQCPNNGQMSWSVFDSEAAAVANRDMHIGIMKSKSITDIKDDTLVPVIFEGVPVEARKITVKIQVPKLVMGGSNVLIAYYVVANVRGKYITCVMSQYTDDTGGKTLAPLLREVMVLKD